MTTTMEEQKQPDESVSPVAAANSPVPNESERTDAHGTMLDQIPGLQAWRRSLIFIGLFLGLFLSLMDTSIMATAVYTISIEFDSLAKTIWAILSYQLAYLGFAMIFARLSDFIGRRSAVILAFVIFVAFSLGCGWAQNIDQLIAFRAVQGIGGAGLYALALILLIEVSTVKMVALTSSLIGGAVAIAGVLGPVIGGLFTEYVSWRWIFWINGPCGLVAALCFIIGWPTSTKGSAYLSSRRKWAEFDFIGALLLMAASVLVVFGLQEGGAGDYAWSSAVVVATITVGVVCWFLLFGWEFYIYRTRHTKRVASMLPLEILTYKPMLAGIISTLLSGYIFFQAVVALPLRFQIVNLKSPAGAGVHLLPLLCACGLGSFLGGAISSKKNLTFYTFMASGCLIIIGSGLFSTLGSSISIEHKNYGFQVILGLGVGLTFSSISVLISRTTTSDTHSVAQGIVAQLRILGGSIGVAANNAVFNVTAAKDLKGVLTPEQIAGIQKNTSVVQTLDLAGRNAVRIAYSDAFNKSMRICVYVAAVGVVASLFTWQPKPPAAEQPQEPKSAEGDESS